MIIFDKVKSSGIWQTIEVVVSLLAQFLYIAIMARILSKPDFGLIAIANSFVALGSLFAESGMGAALIQRKNITNKHINAALQGGILFGIVLFSILFFISPLIASFFGQKELKDLLRVISISIFISSISSVSLGILTKYFKFKEKSITTSVSLLISYSFGIYLGFNGYGVWSLVYASLTLTILQTIGYFYFSRIKILKGVFLKEWKELFSFGFGMVLLKISNYMGSYGLNLTLGKIFNPGLLGVFERTYRIKTLPSLYIGNILDTVMFPAMSEIQDENERLFKIYQFSLGMVNTILMPLSLYLIFFSKEIVHILLGTKWPEAVIPLQIMFIVLTFSSSGRMVDSVIRAKGMIYKNVIRKFLYVIVLITCTSFGGYKFGLIGAAIGVTISYFFNYVIMLFLVRHIFQKSFSEIFLSPLLEGAKLTTYLLIILIGIKGLTNMLDISSVMLFVIISFILMIGVLLALWKNPTLFGKYVNHLVVRLKTKTNPSINQF